MFVYGGHLGFAFCFSQHIAIINTLRGNLQLQHQNIISTSSRIMASSKSLLQLRELVTLGQRCSMASQATASKMVKPPVPMFGVDGRYASALYSAASKKNKLEVVDKNLKTLLELQQKDEKFRDFLINPLIKVSEDYEGLYLIKL